MGGKTFRNLQEKIKKSKEKLQMPQERINTENTSNQMKAVENELDVLLKHEEIY